MKYRHDWWRDQDTCNPCDEDYSQEKHIVLIESQAYENRTGEDEPNKHTQKFWENCNLVFDDRVTQEEICDW